ncbi:MAG TPA: zf-HC2 domain-containing protein [Methylomirabilota bacterium]|nr:zf-HC2 domain-containing protein [Methylomirabilota bacterium]
MTCNEAIDVLADFLEQSLTDELAAALEQHLVDCAPCRAYLSTYRKTRDLTRRAGRVPMPEEMKQRLHQFLRERLGRAEAN